MSDTDFYIRYYVGMCLESLESGHFWYYSSVGVYGVSDATFAQTKISKWPDNFINGTLFYIIYQFHNSFLGLLTLKKATRVNSDTSSSNSNSVQMEKWDMQITQTTKTIQWSERKLTSTDAFFQVRFKGRVFRPNKQGTIISCESYHLLF